MSTESDTSLITGDPWPYTWAWPDYPPYSPYPYNPYYQFYPNTTYINEDKGWKCPKCDRVYGPSVEECKYCNAKISE